MEAIPINPDSVKNTEAKERWAALLARPMKVTVFGAGSFGTALAQVAARAGHSVVILTRDATVADSINTSHKNPTRFSDYELLPKITATTSIKEAMTDCDLIIHCIPAQATPGFLRNLKDEIPTHIPLVSTSKGIVEATHQLISDAIKDALDGRPQPLAFMSGPSFAKEIMQDHPMALVVASEDPDVARIVQHALSSRSFRLYASTDVIGVEIGGAIKNPLAIGAGMAAGLGFGQSSLAALITRGCAELQRLAVAMGGRPETMTGLSGIGDLMLTSFSPLSRNRTLGYNMAFHGMTLEEALAASGEVVEGVATARVASALCKKLGIELPLFQYMSAILDGKVGCKEALDMIMTRPLGTEDKKPI